MATFSKTFTEGSYEWQSPSNAYVLELILTYAGSSQEHNTSQIQYKLQLCAGRQNRFEWSLTANLNLGGTDIKPYTGYRYLDFNETWVLLSGTQTVPHNDDGTLELAFTASITVPPGNDWAPPSMEIKDSMELPTIIRAATISSAADVSLGAACSVSWNVNAAAHRFKLKFQKGEWSNTTGVIYPGKAGPYRYAGYELPMEIAKEFDEASSAVSVTLYTYSDSSGTAQLGKADTETFTVTVPDSGDTRPQVQMAVSGSGTMNGHYVQGVTCIRAEVTASDPYGAQISRTGYTADGKTYESGALSDVLQNAGTVQVTAYAENSRGFQSSASQMLYIEPYDRPKLSNVRICRCDSAGLESDSGTYLRIQADVSYARVEVNGQQSNHCVVAYQYRPYGGSNSEPVELGRDISTLDSGPLSLGLSVQQNYQVLVTVTDDAGNTASWENTVRSERIYRHKPVGGRGVGYGKFCTREDCLDTAWVISSDRDVQVQLDENTTVSLVDIAQRLAALEAQQ